MNGLRIARRLAVPTLALLLAGGDARAAQDANGLREAFLEAYQQAEAGAPSATADAPALVDYPLYPYLVGARLRSALAGPADAAAVDRQVEAFLADHAGDPVGRWVRRPWLGRLAERGQWETFLRIYPTAQQPDQALRCQALQARIALGRTEGLAEAATAEWLTPRSADEACDPAFDWLRATDRLDDSLIERRARLALAAGDAGLARWLAKSLPEARAAPLREWAALLDNPAGAIDGLIREPGRSVEPEALLDGWTRLARRDPQAADARYRTLLASRGNDPALASRLARELALGLSWSRLHGATDYFARIDTADFDELAHEWHVRAALWAGDWKRAGEAIEAMPQALRESSRWRYWEARAAEANGETQRAAALYDSVIPTDNWFAVLSAARRGQPFEPHQQAAVLDAGLAASLGNLPGLVRARELFAVGLVPLAQSEWNAAYEPLDAAARRAALSLAKRWGWHFQVIASAAQQGLFDDYELLYPTPFDREVESAARRSGLAPTLVYAVLRQESLYQSWAVSAAGAVGLMQLMPPTARLTARRERLPHPTPASLQDPAVNLPLGAATLADVIARFDGQVLPALAAYNAGPNAARRWMPPQPMDADVWVENIPYNETRAYVQRIMWHSVVFQWLHDREPERASAWLGQVKPAD